MKKMFIIIGIIGIFGLCIYLADFVLDIMMDTTNPDGWKEIYFEKKCNMLVPQTYSIEKCNSSDIITNHFFKIKEKGEVKFVGWFVPENVNKKVNFEKEGYIINVGYMEDDNIMDIASYSNCSIWIKKKITINKKRIISYVIEMDGNFGTDDELTLYLVDLIPQKGDKYIIDNIARNLLYDKGLF